MNTLIYGQKQNIKIVEKETARIEAFSDGVFAIAITLLVLDLHLPELKSAQNAGLLVSYLCDKWPSYLAFSLSFFSIFIIWVNHHKIFKQIYKRNTAIMFANGLLLFLVTVVSYTTALLSGYLNGSAAYIVVAIYTGLFVLINLSFNLLWFAASHRQNLLRPELTPATIKGITHTYLYGLPVHLAAFVISFFNPIAALIVCVLLWLFWSFTSGKVQLNNQS